MKSILVIGDVITDRYVYGTKLGLSAETPTLVAKHLKTEETMGGAGLVARHLGELNEGGSTLQPVLITVGEQYKDFNCLPKYAHHDDLFSCYMSKMHNYSNVIKERMFVDGYKLLQFDQINDETSYSEHQYKVITECIRTNLSHSRAVIIADNRHGMMTKKLAEYVVQYCKKLKIPLFVDSQVSQSKSNHYWYIGADFFFMNKKEYLEADIGKIENSCIIHKRGEYGASYLNYISKPKDNLNIIDTCGAGDAFMSMFVTVFNGNNYQRSLDRAVEYASFTCTYMGAKTPKEAGVTF